MLLGTKVGLGQDNIVLDGNPALSPQRDAAPNFRPMLVVAKWLEFAGWIKMPLGMEVA